MKAIRDLCADLAREWGTHLEMLVVHIHGEHGEVCGPNGQREEFKVSALPEETDERRHGRALVELIEAHARVHGVASAVAAIGLGLVALSEHHNGDAVRIASGVVLAAARELGEGGRVG